MVVRELSLLLVGGDDDGDDGDDDVGEGAEDDGVEDTDDDTAEIELEVVARREETTRMLLICTASSNVRLISA